MQTPLLKPFPFSLATPNHIQTLKQGLKDELLTNLSSLVGLLGEGVPGVELAASYHSGCLMRLVPLSMGYTVGKIGRVTEKQRFLKNNKMRASVGVNLRRSELLDAQTSEPLSHVNAGLQRLALEDTCQ
jgi:hypothetical protein